MSEENVKLVREGFAGFNRDGLSGLPLSRDFVFVTSPELPDAGEYRGDGAFQWMEEWLGAWESFNIDPLELIDAGDRVVVKVRQRGTIRDIQTQVVGDWWYVCTVSGGEVTRMEAYSEGAQALEAAGLRE